MDAHDLLKRPYARLVTPDTDGSFFAEIVEFPGCFATGKTASEALDNVESVAVDWINTATAQGQDIPEPMESNEYSGKLVLRMSKGLHKRAALWADREGVSLNQFITTCLAEAVGEKARAYSGAYSFPIYPAMSHMTFQAWGTVTMSGANVGGVVSVPVQTGTGNLITTGTNVLELQPIIHSQAQERRRA